MARKLLKFASFFIFPAVVLLFHIIFLFLNFYGRYNWFDIPMHFLGGFAISYTSFLFLKYFERKGNLEIKNKGLFVFVIISIVVSVAVLWEFFEFILNFLNLIPSLGYTDTIKDLFMGLLGGFVGGVIWKNDA